MQLEQKHANVQKPTHKLEQAREDLRPAMIATTASGESIEEIARRLGVTRARVYQV